MPPSDVGRLAVVGLGLIGGSMVRKLADRYSVVGYDADGGTRARSAGYEVADSLEAAVDGAAGVVVAVPPSATAAVVAEVLHLNAEALVTDVASVKAPVVAEVRRGGATERFLPSHPLAGAEVAGWDAARADLLDGTIWAVCPPGPSAPRELLTWWAGVYDAFDARLIVCEAAEHDAAVARTSHAPHVAAEVIAASLEAGPTRLAAALSGGGFRDMTRIARSDPALWEQILRLNGEDVVAVLDEWLVAIAELRDALTNGSDGRIAQAWDRAGAIVDLVDELRWQPSTWEPREFAWPAWDALSELGRAGRSVRRVRATGHGVQAEVSGPGPAVDQPVSGLAERPR